LYKNSAALGVSVVKTPHLPNPFLMLNAMGRPSPRIRIVSGSE
jgi:hypothetical protein